MDGGAPYTNLNEGGGLGLGLRGIESLTENEMLEDSKEDSCSQYNRDDEDDSNESDDDSNDENSTQSPDMIRT